MAKTNSTPNPINPPISFAVVAPVMALLLWAQGRMFLSASGEFDLWVGNTCSSETSQQLFDPYSFTHVLHGFLFFWLVSLAFKWLAPAWQLGIALALEGAWEIFENTRFVIERYRAATASLGYEGDTIVNSLGDLLCALLGFLLARWLGLRYSIIVFLVFELILVLWIHDSLLLQILMLVRPITAIKLWQLCM